MDREQFEIHSRIEDAHWWFTARRAIICRLIRALLPPDSGKRIVDIGCGTGANMAALAASYRCTGIDPSPEGIELARRRFPDCRFICGEAPEALGASMGEADLFLLMDVLEHAEDDAGLLARLTGAARQDAYFVITVPADPALWSKHDEAFGHYRRYDEKTFTKVWDGLPVETLLVSHYNSRLYPLVKMARTLNRIRGKSWGDENTDFRMPLRPLNALLRGIFSGEGNRLTRLLGSNPGTPYSKGVSLVAVLRKR